MQFLLLFSCVLICIGLIIHFLSKKNSSSLVKDDQILKQKENDLKSDIKNLTEEIKNSEKIEREKTQDQIEDFWNKKG